MQWRGFAFRFRVLLGAFINQELGSRDVSMTCCFMESGSVVVLDSTSAPAAKSPCNLATLLARAAARNSEGSDLEFWCLNSEKTSWSAFSLASAAKIPV